MIDKETQAILDAVVFSMKVAADGWDSRWHSLRADQDGDVYAYHYGRVSLGARHFMSLPGDCSLVGAFTPELMEVIDWRTWCVLR